MTCAAYVSLDPLPNNKNGTVCSQNIKEGSQSSPGLRDVDASKTSDTWKDGYDEGDESTLMLQRWLSC